MVNVALTVLAALFLHVTLAVLVTMILPSVLEVLLDCSVG